MAIYYKATRPNGYDFYSGTVDYAGICGTDRLLPLKPTVTECDYSGCGDDVCCGPECCSSEVYHASTSKADTLIGGTWPCRLFEVEGDAVAEQRNKRGFYTLKVIRELPAWEALGPNGEAVAELIDRALTILPGQYAEIPSTALEAAGYRAAQEADRGAAYEAARRAASRSTLRARWAAAQAAGAQVVRDLISPEDFSSMWAPWSETLHADEANK